MPSTNPGDGDRVGGAEMFPRELDSVVVVWARRMGGGGRDAYVLCVKTNSPTSTAAEMMLSKVGEAALALARPAPCLLHMPFASAYAAPPSIQHGFDGVQWYLHSPLLLAF